MLSVVDMNNGLTRCIKRVYSVEKNESDDTRDHCQCPQSENGTQSDFVQPCHVESPDDGQW